MNRIETRTLPCGTIIYSALRVPHDWSPKPLNPQGRITAYAKKIWPDQSWRGHKFEDGSVCSGECEL